MYVSPEYVENSSRTLFSSTVARMHSSCDCKAITLTTPKPDGRINECQCGVCFRYGAIWAYYPLDQITITKQEGRLSS